MQYEKIKKNNKDIIIINWIESPEYEYIKDIIKSPDEKSITYTARSNWKWFIVKDGIISEYYDTIGEVIYSPDWKYLGYIAKKDNLYYIYNGVNIWKHDCQFAHNAEFIIDSNEFYFRTLTNYEWKSEIKRFCHWLEIKNI